MQDAGNPFVIEAPEELDSGTARAFRDDLALALVHVPWIVVDLARTTFVDSSGIGALVAAHKLALSRGGALSLRHVGDRVRQTLRVMGLDDHFGADDGADVIR